jgi:ribonuclease VapC
VIVDTSAILAILFDEPDADRYARAIAEAPSCRLSVAGFLEVAIVLESRGGAEAANELDRFLERAAIELAPITVDHAEAARRAWRRFGRGNHPAGLNFGDCFAYAVAEVSGEPLLFKGEDFSRTDIEAVP